MSPACFTDHLPSSRSNYIRNRLTFSWLTPGFSETVRTKIEGYSGRILTAKLMRLVPYFAHGFDYYVLP